MTASPIDPALAALKREARDDPQKAARQAAIQFEQLFVQMVLKSMREATPQFDPLAGPSARMFHAMLDEQRAKAVAERGIGLAPIIERQLLRHAKPASD
jgi:flagellar protein FlgJ